MKKLALILVLIGLAIGSQAQNKIGHFDLQYVLPLLPEFKQAEATLKVYTDQIKKEIESKQKELEAKAKEFEEKQKSGGWPEPILKTKYAELQSLEAQLQEFQQNAPQDVSAREQKLLAPIYEKVEKAIKEIAESSNFTFIIRSELCYSALEANGISNLVLKKLGVTPPAGTNK